MKKKMNLGKLLTVVLTGSFLIICLICSSSIIYLYMKLSAAHQEELNKAMLENAVSLIREQYEKSCDLVAQCTSIAEIYQLDDRQGEDTLAEKKALIRLHDRFSDYITVSAVGKYVEKATLFRSGGGMVQCVNNNKRIYLQEEEKFWAGELCEEAESMGNVMRFGLYPSTKGETMNFWCLYPVYAKTSNQKIGYMVCEYLPELFTGGLTETENLVYALTDSKGNWLYSSNGQASLEERGLLPYVHGGQTGTFQTNGYSYTIGSLEIQNIGFTLYSIMRVDTPKQIRLLLMGLIILVTVSGAVLTFVTMKLCIGKVTVPIRQIRERLEKIAGSDYSYDASLTELPLDFAQIGNEINRMTECIQKLMDASVEDAKKRKDYEIAALQNQINPHFIYNTLDSIYWMATIQKNTGICAMTDALTKLLRNLAYSPNEKLTLGEELQLLDCYITIQSIRYMDVFDYVCRIPEELLGCKILKFSIQPLVENAIFHGVEPAGRFCTITLSARIRDGALVIEVADNGVGMSREQEELLNYGEKTGEKGQIGARNVRDRLRLMYGEPYGLRYESTPDVGTSAILTIPLEK